MPRKTFSATERAGTSDSSCWIVAMPAASAAGGFHRPTSTPSTRSTPGVGDVHAADDLAERRLAGAVLADEGVDAPRLDVQGDVVERLRRSESLGDALDGDVSPWTVSTRAVTPGCRRSAGPLGDPVGVLLEDLGGHHGDAELVEHVDVVDLFERPRPQLRRSRSAPPRYPSVCGKPLIVASQMPARMPSMATSEARRR